MGAAEVNVFSAFKQISKISKLFRFNSTNLVLSKNMHLLNELISELSI